MNELQTQEGVKALMESSQSEAEWNANCNKVKKANNGYPDFWYPLIVLSGVFSKTSLGWQRGKL